MKRAISTSVSYTHLDVYKRQEFSHYISAIPVPVVLMVSVVDRESHDIASAAFSKLDNVRTLHVRIVPNRGRDIAPFLVEFRDEVLGLDLVCHIHTKKSLYSGGEQSEWRTYLPVSYTHLDVYKRQRCIRAETTEALFPAHLPGPRKPRKITVLQAIASTAAENT